MNGLSSTKVSQFYLGVEQSQKFFTCDFWEILDFFENKKFLSQGVCMLNFLFLEGIQDNVFTIIHQGFIILSGSGTELEIFQWKILCFFESKKFLSQGVCMINFLFLDGTQGHVFTIIHQSLIILSGGGTELEFFYSQNLSFVSVKNFYLSSTA